jgi:7,8-didemethyl-8-hydroxy-5-deazariboflavin synthase CofG subunit
MISVDAATAVDDAEALARRPLDELLAAAAARRDRRWGRVVTYSPKIFLPLTNLCPDRCSYCSFRRSPGDDGAWTMTPAEVIEFLDRGRARGCIEALFCLGDRPERAFASYRAELGRFGHDDTVGYLEWAGHAALERGLLPHTNAGLLSSHEMGRLRAVNVSLGLMLESASERLCAPGMPHHRAPDKRPALRLAMLEEAGRLGIPFTSGILIGIGETVRERLEALVALARLGRRYGHLQEVIVQSFRAPLDFSSVKRARALGMSQAPEPDAAEVAHAIALARLILDDDVAVQAPPNLNHDSVALLLRAGINDFGGISPVTRDYINPRHPWPNVAALADLCAAEGFELRPRLPVYAGHIRALPPTLRAAVARVA